jgi:hypothetical protein
VAAVSEDDGGMQYWQQLGQQQEERDNDNEQE